MTPAERTRGTVVELYGRDDLPAPARGRRDRVAAHLAELESAGTIAGFDVRWWPKRLPRDGTGTREVRDRYLAFADWAEDRGVSLAPFFGTRKCYSTATGERGEWVVLPALCLAVYGDGDLTAVYPHANGDAYRSVLSGLRYLAERADAGPPDSQHATSAD